MRFEILRGPIAKGTIRTTFVLGMRLVVQAGTLLIVARMLGPQQFGAFAGVSALAVILGTLSTFGTHVVLIKSVSSDRSSRHDILAYAIPITTICGCVLLGIYLSTVLLALPETGIPMAALIAIGVTELLMQPLYGLPIAERLAMGQVARSQLMQVLPLALRLITAAAVFMLAPANPLAAYAAGYFAASLVALGFAAMITRDCWPPVRRWRLPSQRELRHTAGYAASNFTSNGPGELDKTLAAKLLPLAMAGLYSAGARVIGAATLPVVAMVLSAVPRLFREGRAQPKRTAHLLRWVFGAALAYGLVLASIMRLIAPCFDWIFGAKYHGLDTMIQWLCLAIPGITLRLAAGTVLVTLDKPWLRVGYEIAGLTVLVVAASILATTVGTVGMPLALALSEWLMAAVGIGLIVKMQRLS
ncbi:lipopolysaccharide biosynthesis protein [Rhodanobacter denitrificans]|uniref:Membrane protein involved in the export of O-antigen and teichoic acid n=1 Tax=Rhodanobacter denitrificans TaxID=666685 RepID=M4NBP6_9GAMM|nr:lipopolysaccharide biosynthesis protein [Rhodanobacter denitrificans]AGG88080.1 membrane protein involved in the export of O-antigen and teichoic acid [Rhodanobacter denitrificans]UJM87234.1 lipopolysaccharide biosynthesis protein [Rhodanobacter denitrificans]